VVNIALVPRPVASGDPARVALIVGAETCTYGDLDDLVRRAAGALIARGVRAGDRVPVAAECEPTSVAAVLGAAWAGASAAVMNPRLTEAELRALIESSGCLRVGFAGEEYGATFDAALGARALRAGDARGGDPGSAPSEPAGADGDEALVLFTSGTTGLPKPVPMTHASIRRRIDAFAPPFDASVPTVVSLMCVPFAHVGGLLGVLVGLAGASTMVIQQRFDAGEWLRLVERYRVARAFLVPTMLRRILDHPGFSRSDLSSLQAVTYGAAPAPQQLVERAVEAMPNVVFVNVFGQTETLGAVTAFAPGDHAAAAARPGSVGQALPGAEIRIVDPATNETVSQGEVGEIWVRAPFTGSEEWIRTGDMGRLDEEGYLYPTGRLTERINRGGEKIVPTEVEAVLRDHPAVADAAVTGIPDADLGERVAAVIVARDPVTADELRAHCRKRLAGYKVPERIEFVDEIPTSDVGKVTRKGLVELLTKTSA
jgi:acyl-CoA synthetase (AMP-forming)/AMP-acid ligase II